MATTGVILVDPAVLSAKANSFHSQAVMVKSMHDDMIARANALASAWEGSASDAFRTKFNALQTAMDKIFSTIEEHSNDLTTMAEQYTSAESQAQSEIDSLPASNLG